MSAACTLAGCSPARCAFGASCAYRKEAGKPALVSLPPDWLERFLRLRAEHKLRALFVGPWKIDAKARESASEAPE